MPQALLPRTHWPKPRNSSCQKWWSSAFQDQLRRIDSLQCDIDQLDKRLASMVQQNQHMLALQTIPGINPLTATALVSTATDLSSFESGRRIRRLAGTDAPDRLAPEEDPAVGDIKRGTFPGVRTMC